MSILVDRHTRVLVQGLTGAQGAQDTRYALDAGTQVVCGVTPGKGGAGVHGLPVYHTVAAAAAAQGIVPTLAVMPCMPPRRPWSMRRRWRCAMRCTRVWMPDCA